ncbi:MAG: hypothetical protein HYY04_02855 [Chloroflexi bacterium]|nr:hypothetical protein [Chloroflexota bacterium]
MSTRVALAVTYHDPRGRLYEQIARALPALCRLFDSLTVQASAVAHAQSLALLAAHGARVQREAAENQGRRGALMLALQEDTSFIVYCDCDRALHWVEQYPAELAEVVRRIPDHDFTVLGRTRRAFDTHPRVQRDTEAIVNHVFAVVSGHDWDVTSAARGLSRRAAEAVVPGCPDDFITTDVAWPLYLLRAGGFSLGYIATEGSQFETGDRHADGIAAAGGHDRWLAHLDADPQRWARRMEMARREVEAMIPYAEP